ncbi:MAG: aromatic ring-hydroxylating dioxygenase subunit alpha [Dehalococcoidia bacterium]|nr:aromatic ring-hydroxylating dioxygenase subunit alpha [Dehalococcoidia bacterium]
MATARKSRSKNGQINARAGSMVDLDAGLISREVFVSPEIYAQEQEQLFARAWLYIGHESQVSKPGDFFVSSMGEESVILCRDRQDEIHVFLNSCAHRGMKVCRYDEGNTPVFSCPYHGWSYATDGKLVGVPYFKDAYQENLDKSKWGLPEVAQMCNYKGTIWATWDKHAPSFPEYIGGFRTYLDFLLDTWDGAGGETEVFGGIEKWVIPCNWKFPAENFIGDRYHNISHRSVDMVGVGPSGSGRRDNQEREGATALDISFPERGHGTLTFLRPDDKVIPGYQHSKIVSEYFAHCETERRKNYGQWSRLIPGPSTVFPNMSYLPRQPRTIATWHPRGPNSHEAWRWFLVDKNAPPEVKEFLRLYYISYSGPGGLTEQDDMENWNYAHNASQGVIARRHPYNYQMGMGFDAPPVDTDGLDMPGQIRNVTTAKAAEQNQRGFYQRWSEFMNADDWDTLATWRNGHANGTNTGNGKAL